MKILGNVRSISKKFYFGRLSLCPNKHCNFSSLTQIKIPYSLSRDITFSNNEINDNIKNIRIMSCSDIIFSI